MLHMSTEFWFILAIVLFAAAFPTGFIHKCVKFGAEKGDRFGKEMAEKISGFRK